MEKKIKINEIVYFLYFAVMFGARASGLCEGMMLYNITLVIGMLLFGVKVLATEHTVLEYIVIAALIGMSLLVYRNTGEKGLLLCMTMMLGMKGVSLLRVEKVGLTILGVCFPALVFLTVFGIIPDISYPADGRLLPGQMLRRSLGYPYFNTMFTTFIILVTLIMLVGLRYHRGNKTLIISSLFLFVIGVYLYIYSCSNTGIIVLTLFLLVNLYLQMRSRISKAGKALIIAIYPLFMAISIFCPLLIGGDTFGLLDRIFHNRFNYANYYLTHEPVTLFGVRFAPAPNDNYLIDSSFLYSFLQIGVIPCIILTVLMITMIVRMTRQDRRVELAVIVSLCVLGLSDPFFYNLSYKNILMLFVGEMFYELMPDVKGVLGKKICILKVGNSEIEYGNFPVYKAWKRVGSFLSGMFAENGIVRLLVMILISVLVFSAMYYSGKSAAVSGIVDTIPEWEYLRRAMSCGLWLGMTVMVALGIMKKAKGNRL